MTTAATTPQTAPQTTIETLTDHQALARWASTSDAAAFAALVARYQGMVYATCVRILSDRAEAEDAAQETFFKLCRSAGSVRGSVPAWLHACATGTAIDALRKRAASDRRERAAARPEGTAAAHPTWSEIEPILDRALSTLPVDERGAIIGHYLAGRTQAELASELGTSPGTMSRTISRALERLRVALSREGVTTASAAALAAAIGVGATSIALPTTLAARLAGVSLGGAASRVATPALLARPGIIAGLAAVGVAVVSTGAWLAFAGPTPAPITPPVVAMAVAAEPAAGAGVDRPRRASRGYVMLEQRVDGQIIGAFTLRVTPETFEFIGVPDDEESKGNTRIVLKRRSDEEPVASAKPLKNSETMSVATYDIGPEPLRKGMIGQRSTVYWQTRGEMMLTRMATDGAPGESDSLFWRRTQPSTAPDPADPLVGQWTQIPAWWSMRMDADEIILEGGGGEYGELNSTEKPFQMVRYRVMTWDKKDDLTRIEAICGNNQLAPKLIGKRVKLILRSIDGGYEMAIREFSAPPSDAWPTFTPKAGDRVHVARFARELR